jgi:hypothetical protein
LYDDLFFYRWIMTTSKFSINILICSFKLYKILLLLHVFMNLYKHLIWIAFFNIAFMVFSYNNLFLCSWRMTTFKYNINMLVCQSKCKVSVKLYKILLFSTNLCHALSLLTPKIPWDQKLVDRCLGSLCEEKYFFFNFFF